VGFCIVAGPWILVLSLSKGHLTYSDTGRLNYAWYVNGSAGNRHWQGEHHGAGEPLHPTRKLHSDPAVFEFASPIPGTYSPWYDPSYWNEGLQITFDLKKQLDVFVYHLRQYFSTMYGIVRVPIFVLILFVVCSRYPSRFPRKFLALWPIVLPSVAAFVLYALVHVELRFLGAFALIILTSAFASAEPEGGYLAKRVLAIGLVLLLLVGPLNTAYLRGELTGDVSAIVNGNTTFDPYGGISEGLLAMGVRPGDTIAVIGANSSAAVWARRARAKIVAEIPSYESKQYWELDGDSRRQVLKLFSVLSVSAVVARRAPAVLPQEEGWMRIPNSDLYIIPRESLP
jgi:hypothetical protein